MALPCPDEEGVIIFGILSNDVIARICIRFGDLLRGKVNDGLQKMACIKQLREKHETKKFWKYVFSSWFLEDEVLSEKLGISNHRLQHEKD